MKIQHKIEQSGEGWLSVEKLVALVEDLAEVAPPGAAVNVQSIDNQREGKSWRLVVGWEEEL